MQLLKDIKQYVVDTSHELSVHGFIFLVKRGTSIVERAVWLVCICIGVYGIIKLGTDTWNRYQTNPTVISMDRNKFAWNSSFPSCKSIEMKSFESLRNVLLPTVTVCPEKRIDEEKLTHYVNSHGDLYPNESAKANVRTFLKRLATISFETMGDFPLDIDSGISPDHYLDLMNELKWDFIPEISSGTSNKLQIMRTITEHGICDAVNSRVSYYNTYEYWKANRWDLVKPNITVVVHPFDGEIYAQLTNLSTSYEVFFHGAMEAPDISKQKYLFPETDYTTVEFLALEILTSDEAKR